MNNNKSKLKTDKLPIFKAICTDYNEEMNIIDIHLKDLFEFKCISLIIKKPILEIKYKDGSIYLEMFDNSTRYNLEIKKSTKKPKKIKSNQSYHG